eukprot:TRINITY_DN2358_c0_g1_i1.p1 TRINITY_DN2358_c0_g1~~TRINITY_DN2358_c0_g1_i1.p1  ORF type:complete len:522 (-),score=60.37 TRINITY_DN2358_c0_g1_i1:978-2543(-)
MSSPNTQQGLESFHAHPSSPSASQVNEEKKNLKGDSPEQRYMEDAQQFKTIQFGQQGKETPQKSASFESSTGPLAFQSSGNEASSSCCNDICSITSLKDLQDISDSQSAMCDVFELMSAAIIRVCSQGNEVYKTQKSIQKPQSAGLISSVDSAQEEQQAQRVASPRNVRWALEEEVHPSPNNEEEQDQFQQTSQESTQVMHSSQLKFRRVQTTRQGGEIDVPMVHRNSPYKYDICMDVDIEKDVDYNERGFLGEGSFGRVFQGTWEGKRVAVKIFKEEYQNSLGQECNRLFNTEFDIMARVQHENIVECYGGCKEFSKRAILMEFMDKGSLDTFIHKNSHPIKLVNYYKILKSITKALAYLHPSIVHRDIKPQNVLLNKQGLVKVADFGLSKFKEATTMFSSNAAGTPHYVAPEILTGKFKTGPLADIFSVAILMWEMYTRIRPWQGVKDYQIAYLVMTDQRPEIPEDCPEELSSMIRRCWSADPDERLSAQELYQWCKEQIEVENAREEPILLYKPKIQQ